MASAKQNVDGKLGLYGEEQRIREIEWKRNMQQRREQQQRKPKNRSRDLER